MMNKFKIKKIILVAIIMVVSLYNFSFALIIPKKFINGNEAADTSQIDKFIYDYDIETNGLISKDVKVDDIVSFGKFYDLNENNETIKVPISWKVLTIENDHVLLITKDIIKTLPYNTTWNPINWRDCSLRKWLNDDFYDIAFNEYEKAYISEVINNNNGNEKHKIKQNFDTLDKVFLLSAEEVRRFFYRKSMQALGTKYALNEGLWVAKNGSSEGYSVWWLRNTGKNTSFASLIHAGGSVGDDGDGVATKGNGLRPCIWVKMK